MPNVFEYASYKKFLKDLIAANASIRGYHGQLAKAARCQASYLSQALKTKVELTPDHAAGMAKFIGMTKLETEYFLNLVLLERASLPELKEVATDRLQQLRVDNSNLSKVIAQEKVKSLDQSFYYSSWIYLAVHMSIGIPEFQNEEALAQRLSVPRAMIARTLHRLHSEGLARLVDGRWEPSGNESHLSSDSFMTETNHANWRARAILDIQKDPAAWVHYTSVFTMSRDDAAQLKAMVLKFIEQTRKVIHPSPQEEVFSLLVDFFPA